MLRESIELHRQGRLAEAEDGYRSVLATQPNDGEAIRLLGILRRDRGDLAESEQLFARAHALAPEQPNLLLMLGAVRYQGGDYELARDAYERALALDPNLSGAHTTLGHIAMMSGNNTLAEQYFRTALRVKEDAQAYSGLGMLALEREDNDVAMKHLTRAADLSPNDAAIAFSLGRGFSRRGMIAFAEQAFRKALQLRPGLPQAHNALGQLLLTAERAAEAEPHMRALIGVRNFDLPGTLGLGDVHRALGQFDAAIAQYRRALELQPDHEAGFEALLWCLQQLGRTAEVLELLDRRIMQFPAQERWRAERATIHSRLGRHGDASTDWQVLHDRHPTSQQAAAELASARERNGELETAAAIADRAAVHFPQDATLALVRARAAFRHGDDATARKVLATLQSKPTSEHNARHALNYLGLLHDRAGEYDEAVRDFSAAQRGMQTLLPSLESVPAEYDAVLAGPLDAPWQHAPILLLGAPGSGVERIAALLADQPQLAVLRDRAQRPRNDGFDTRSFDHTHSELDSLRVDTLREEYLAPLRAMNVPFERTLVDWIPRWDARHLIFARRFLPGSRIIIVDRDARDSLLDWLAFGWLPGAAMSDLDMSAKWLARARAHLHFGVEHGGLDHLVINAEQVLADPAGAGAELARFVGVDTLVEGKGAATARQALGGMPTCFVDGRWNVYAETLADAFTTVTRDPYAQS